MTDDARKPSHQWSVSYDLGNGRSIAVSANFHVGDDEATMSNQFDAIMRVLERQRARAEVELLDAELKLRVKNRGMIELQLAEMVERHKVLVAARRVQDKGLVAQLESQIAQHRVNLEKMKIEVADGEATLEEGRRKAA